MKELIRKMRILEQKMERAEQQTEYWLQEEHFDMEKSNSFETESDLIYENLYELFNQVADRIVSITSSRIDKDTALTMIQKRRSDVERILGGIIDV